MSHGVGALSVDLFSYGYNMVINILNVFYMVGMPASVIVLGDFGVFHARVTLL